MSLRTLLVVLALSILSRADFAAAAAPRVLPEGKLPDDVRLGELRTLDSYFPFAVPDTREAWAQRAERTRRRILVAMGLYPMPERTRAQAVVHGRVDRGDYTVERVYFQSYPGHFVTGSLFRPVGRTGRLPGVLCPHGHWANGRFFDAGEEEAKKQIATGAESMMSGARFPLQARCVQLARMGCVVFHYDMLGNADSFQIPLEIAHGFRDRRPDLERPDRWGFFSPQAELRLQSIMGLQTYNSIRALDWLSNLPDVDPQRIGVTGASGGGTQTFILSAIDPRPAVEFPAVMVSTAMQGGCTCENACYLRTGVGNVDFAACFAPKPLGMTAADDWTKELETKGLPELKQLYGLLGQPGKVSATIRLEFGHNYNAVSRQAMYHWFNTHLLLGYAEPIVEQDFQPLTRDELTVWDDAHPQPAADANYEPSLLQTVDAASHEALAADPTQFTRLAYDVVIDRQVPAEGEIAQRKVFDNDRGDYRELGGLIELPARGEQLPEVFLMPKNATGDVVIWIDGRGKDALFDAQGQPLPEIARLLAAGKSVACVDLIGQGECKSDSAAKDENRRVKEDRNFAGYTYGYNSPLFVQRVHDILTVVGLTKLHAKDGDQIELVGVHGAGLWVAAAAAQAGEAVDGVAIDTEGFRFANLTSYADPLFLPGAVKYGDVPGLLSLLDKQPLWLAGENAQTIDELNQNRAERGAAGIICPKETAEEKSSAVVDWLLKVSQ
ncbi:MAG: acetylxylan esterase [Planctomycetia bacterium]|nr:acetylxylan esterase [Planctomycetia bacterium]